MGDIDSNYTIEKGMKLKSIQKWRDDLEKKYGQKIIPGCAKYEELNEDEKIARMLYESFGKTIEKYTGLSFKLADKVYCITSKIQYFNKTKLPNYLITILIILVFISLIKYLFF